MASESILWLKKLQVARFYYTPHDLSTSHIDIDTQHRHRHSLEALTVEYCRADAAASTATSCASCCAAETLSSSLAA